MNISPVLRARGSNITANRMSVVQQDIEENFINSIENNNVDKIKQFLSSGYHVNSFLRSRHIIWDTNCFTILCKSIQTDQIPRKRSFLTSHLLSYDFLALAAHMGAVEIVSFLIKRNVIINQTDNIQNRTALHWAAASGNFDICKMLIDAGKSTLELLRCWELLSFESWTFIHVSFRSLGERSR